MKLVDIIKKSDKTLFSIEILPPLKGKGIQSIYSNINPLLEFKPAFIDVTYHREEYVYKKRPGGYLEKVSVRKRPGTVGICAALMYKYNIETVPHMICGGFNKEETENALIDLHFLGIQNVLALRGDSIKSEPYFVPEPGGHSYAIDLVKQIAAMNRGIYLDEEMKDAEPTDFCIGVAGYPEKHFEAPNMLSDLMYLKQKIEAGAHYIVTQMFFDNKKYFDFVERCKEVGINVPIIPGIKILTSKKQLLTIPKTFHVEIPYDLYNEINKCKTDEEVKEVGIQWCVEQCKELIRHQVPCLHFYTMGQSETTYKVASQIF
ncbi:MAG: methylenetetrahydrofolate reductase [NAD(P)H] [Bacteroidia bacterium]